MLRVLKSTGRASCVAAAALGCAAGAAAQTAAAPEAVVVRLERTSCFGECPVYSVTIDGRGNVVYEGAKFVRVEGRQTDTIPASRVAAIVATAERIGFFGLRDQYRSIRNPDGTTSSVTDLPTTIVTISRDGKPKRVEDYIGAPEGLKQLEREIDEAARTKRWILLDEATLAQLVRDGWTPSPEERADLLRRALRDDDVPVVKGLLDIGADANATYFGTGTTPLMMVRSAPAARLLLDAGANPLATNDNGATAMYWAAHLAPDVAKALLEAGARADDPADSYGRTPLWYAACGGNAGVVDVLLAAGANPAAAASGKSAIDCAKEARDMDRSPRPSGLDGKPPFVKDFTRTIALLEQAIRKRPRHEQAGHRTTAGLTEQRAIAVAGRRRRPRAPRLRR